jgi:hypothetical protein
MQNDNICNMITVAPRLPVYVKATPRSIRYTVEDVWNNYPVKWNTHPFSLHSLDASLKNA